MATRRRSSVKRLRVDKRKKFHNLKIKNQLKKTLKKFQTLLSAKKIDEAKGFLKEVSKQLDKAAKKNIIHRNTASRRKSRLARRLTKGA